MNKILPYLISFTFLLPIVLAVYLLHNPNEKFLISEDAKRAVGVKKLANASLEYFATNDRLPNYEDCGEEWISGCIVPGVIDGIEINNEYKDESFSCGGESGYCIASGSGKFVIYAAMESLKQTQNCFEGQGNAYYAFILEGEDERDGIVCAQKEDFLQTVEFAI